MTFEEYQKEVDKLLKDPERTSLELLVGQLCSEAGEAFGKLTKISRLAYKIRNQCAPIDAAIQMEQLDKDFRKELGDTQFYLAAIHILKEWELENTAFQNIAKLQDRLARNVLTSGSGDNR